MRVCVRVRARRHAVAHTCTHPHKRARITPHQLWNVGRFYAAMLFLSLLGGFVCRVSRNTLDSISPGRRSPHITHARRVFFAPASRTHTQNLLDDDDDDDDDDDEQHLLCVVRAGALYNYGTNRRTRTAETMRRSHPTLDFCSQNTHTHTLSLSLAHGAGDVAAGGLSWPFFPLLP